MEKLEKGRHVSTTSSNDGNKPIHYYLVDVDSNPVGAGIYVGESEDFLTAIIGNSEGKIEQVNEALSNKALEEELERTFKSHFK